MHMKRPIILPKKSWLTDLIVTEYHWKYKHQNHQTVMNEVQQKFDIPGLRSACHRVRNNCFRCSLHQFWKKWLASYLPTLTRRSKWFETQPPLQLGDLVLIVDDALPRGCWPKGRIVQLVPSKDGTTRRVHVQLANKKIIERMV
uniref:DUF5641 domain-containing protein n=1 Tax=Anopheles arabiensis TaxID=7173 RepID=A0A182HML9_ANOAR